MNTLSKDEALLFHKLMNLLLFYVNKKIDIIKNVSTIKEFLNRDVEETVSIRKKIFSEKYNFIDNYIQENPDKLSQEEIQIILSWKRYKTDKFFIIKHTKEYSLFFGSNKVYGVKGITDSFEEKFEGHAPIIVSITLIPFKDNIIYDGLFSPFNISLGGGIRRSLKQESGEAIQRFGIVTSLNTNLVVKEKNDEEMLRFYMESSDNRMRYEEEISSLRNKSKYLEAIYYQEEARTYARHSRKMLKRCGVKGNFAVLEHTVVASGKTEKELKENIEKMVPEDKLSWIYSFKV